MPLPHFTSNLSSDNIQYNKDKLLGYIMKECDLTDDDFEYNERIDAVIRDLKINKILK